MVTRLSGLVPLDVTTRVRIDRVGVEQIRAGGTPFHAAVADQVTAYPRFAEHGWTNLHDPLAVASVVRPNLVRKERLHADVELTGELTKGMTLFRTPTHEAPANVHVALGVDGPSVEAMLIRRLSRE